MKKKIAILGSTGSIGKILLKIIEKDKKNFDIVLLTANTDHKTLLKQAKKFNVQNLIISDFKSYKVLENKAKKSKTKIFNSFNSINKILNKKIDYVMSSIVGIQGLEPTYRIIKFTKNIAIANKESIICGWDLINNELKKNKTNFIPVDSEHFSMWYGLFKLNSENLEKIFITASGGPFYKFPLSKFKKISVKKAINHPHWKMGKKISIDSATMINKVYEVIEAKNIFNISYKKINVIIHPKSYVHAILKFSDGLIKIIAHDTTMKVPIFNTLFFKTNLKLKTNKLDFKLLNDLNFQKIHSNRYPMINILKLLPEKHSLYETVVVSANDTLVNLFLEKKIGFLDIYKELIKFIKLKDYLKYKHIKPKKINDIINLNNYVTTNIKKKYIV